MDHKNNKNTEIKFRINKQEKEKLQYLSDKYKKSLSSYIRKKCLADTDDQLRLIPDAVETWEAYNEILLAVKASQDTGLYDVINDIITRHLPRI